MANTYIKDTKKLQEKIQKMLLEIHSNEDPLVLNEYRKFFKKNVGFFSRTYVAAFMIKNFLGTSNVSFSSNNRSMPNNTRENIRREPQSSSSSSSSSNNNVNTPNNTIKRISVNVGTNQATKEEVTTFLNSLPNMSDSGLEFVSQTPRITIFTIKHSSFKPLLNGIKNNTFKGKKLFVDLRGRI